MGFNIVEVSLKPLPKHYGRIACIRHWFFLLFFFLANAPLNGTDYFVRSNGNDEASGTATNTAWQTIERVNRAVLKPGDRVLFGAGQVFPGNLRLSAEDAGASNRFVVVGSFGTGKARILAGKGTGVTVEGAGNIAIKDLIITGAGRTNNTGYGILCDNRRIDETPIDNLRIENVEVSGFGIHGILVSGVRAGFRHVRISDCLMHDNLRGGMEVAGRLPYDSSRYAHFDVHVSRCRAFNNSGDPDYLKNHSGSGIVLYQVDGGLMEGSTAWNNGTLCHSQGGGVGLWACASRRVVIQHCESFANKTSGADGGGFDLDGGCEECVLQYNYSHDNDGPGLMVYTYPYASYKDRANVVRFNISSNDSRKSRTYAGLWIRNDGNGMTGLEVYNNTVFVGPWTDQAASILGGEVEARLRNNIFVASGGAIPLRVEQSEGKVHCENNLYWRDGAPFRVLWDGREYTTLEDWRKGGKQELLNNNLVGFFQDPTLSSFDETKEANGTIRLSALRSFRLLPGSPALTNGLDLRRFGMDIGMHDFLGRTFATNTPMTLGAVR